MSGIDEQKFKFFKGTGVFSPEYKEQSKCLKCGEEVLTWWIYTKEKWYSLEKLYGVVNVTDIYNGPSIIPSVTRSEKILVPGDIVRFESGSCGCSYNKRRKGFYMLLGIVNGLLKDGKKT